VGSRAALAKPAARAFGEPRAPLAARLAGDDEAARLLNAPHWAAAMSQAAALKRRLERPAGLRAAVGLAEDEPPAGTAPDAADGDGGDGGEPAAFLRLAQRVWDGACVREERIADPALRAWRRRRMARCDGQLARANARGLLHAPVAFELSGGCSRHCWFCAMAAEPPTDVFRYTPRNARLWREVLAAVGDVVGPAAAKGGCCWATEPFDNPDYERFAGDFHDVLGELPQATTAMALADPARTRALLDLSLRRGAPRNRFSVLSAPMPRRLYRELTPQELPLVHLVPHVEGGARRFAAGRAREPHGVALNAASPARPGASARPSGFLIGMTERRVSLPSPCPADERWPLGSVVFAEARFDGADDLGRGLRRPIAEHMPATWPVGSPVGLRADATCAYANGRLELTAAYATHTVSGDASLRTLGALLSEGGHAADEIAARAHWRGWSERRVQETLDLLLAHGPDETTGAVAGPLPGVP